LVIPGKTALNTNYQYMSYQTVKKLVELVKAGATIIVAEKPSYQNGIQQKTNTAYHKVINEIWGGIFQATKDSQGLVAIKKLGLGKIVKSPYRAADFKNLGVAPDFEAYNITNKQVDSAYAKKIAYVHRRSATREVYFISNQENKARTIEAHFLIHNKKPKIYNPVTDEFTTATVWTAALKHTNVLLQLPANGSLFVIFEEPTKEDKYIVVEKRSRSHQDLSKNWQVKFDPAFGGPSDAVEMKTLTDWTLHENDQVKYYSGTAAYTKTFTFNGDTSRNIWLDLGKFENIAEVKVNGISCGILWTPPFKADISKAIRKGENQLTIEVTNTWANRLIGDHKLPENKRLTKTTAPFRLDGKPLNSAGLLGPITIQIEEK
jgi:hypothetical protein